MEKVDKITVVLIRRKKEVTLNFEFYTDSKKTKPVSLFMLGTKSKDTQKDVLKTSSDSSPSKPMVVSRRKRKRNSVRTVAIKFDKSALWVSPKCIDSKRKIYLSIIKSANRFKSCYASVFDESEKIKVDFTFHWNILPSRKRHQVRIKDENIVTIIDGDHVEQKNLSRQNFMQRT